MGHGVLLWIDVQWPHGSGSPCARLPLAAPIRRLKVRPQPPRGSHAYPVPTGETMGHGCHRAGGTLRHRPHCILLSESARAVAGETWWRTPAAAGWLVCGSVLAGWWWSGDAAVFALVGGVCVLSCNSWPLAEEMCSRRVEEMCSRRVSICTDSDVNCSRRGPGCGRVRVCVFS